MVNIKMSGIGECVASAILDKPMPFDIKALRLERFAEDESMFLAYGPSARA